MSKSIKSIGLLEDNHILRKYIEEYLYRHSYEVLFSGADIGDYKQTSTEQVPDCILLDIHLKDGNSLEHLAAIKEDYPTTKIIIMTSDDSNGFIMKAFERGACGYIYKPFTMTAIVETFKQLEENGSYIQPQVATKLLGMLEKKDTLAELQQQFKLTDRELEVISLLKEGLSYKEIGQKLFISHHTVNHHLKSVYIKMDVQSKKELVATYFMGKNNNLA